MTAHHSWYVTAMLLLVVRLGDSFTWNARPSRLLHHPSTTQLGLTYDPYNDYSSSNRDAWARNKARTDIRNFLTQRSIQSFVFLLNQCHEGHTVRWLENKLDFKKIDSFHGTGAFNTTMFPEWDSLLLDLATQDPETVIVEVVQKKRQHRGWGHQGNYIDSIGSTRKCTNGDDDSSSTASEINSPEPSPSITRRSRGFTGNYLANLNNNNNSPTPSLTPASKPQSPFQRPVTKTLGVQGSYLDMLNQQPSPKEEVASSKDQQQKHRHQNTKRSGRKTRKERDTLNRKKNDAKMNVVEESKQEEDSSPPISKIGSQRGYLSSLQSNTFEKSKEEAPVERVENPFLVEKTLEYQFEIDPPSLVTRIISVREQISKEWKDDLATLVRTNDRILDEYEENQRRAEASQLNEDDDDDDDDDDDGEGDRESKHFSKVSYPNEMITPYRASQEGTTLTYDRNAMMYLTNSIASQDRASSPFRRSNFDLLVLLCTQESIHRVLREFQTDTNDKMHMEKHAWLHGFYKDHVKQYFDGHEHSFGRADKFLETLLVQSPSAHETRQGGLYLIDPIAIAEDILRERSMVAREWKSIMDTIPDEHLGLRRILFTRHLMEATNWKLNGIGANSLHIEEPPLSESIYDSGIGTFE